MKVSCDKWFEAHSVPDSILTCHYSRANHSLAVTHVDVTRDARDLLLCVFIPLLILMSSALTLAILHAKCCKQILKNQRFGGNLVEVLAPIIEQ